MIEASPHLRKQQSRLLCGNESLKEIELGWTNTCKYIPGCSIVWCEDLRFVPKGRSLHFKYELARPPLIRIPEKTSTPFILAHEFFDALPIHIFQNQTSSAIPSSSIILTPTGPIKPKQGPHSPQNQWHELVVSPIPPLSNIVASERATTDSATNPPPEFQLSVSKTPTPHSLYLPQLSERYKALSKTPGAVIEISPESLSYIADFAARIGGSNPSSSSSAAPTPNPLTTTESNPTKTFTKPHPSGAALILDYGPQSRIPANTLRGIRSHKLVSPFSAPGTVDLSADVDFMALAETAIASSPGVEVHGPVQQADWLESMGVRERVGRLMGSVSKTEEEKARRMEGSWKRLVDRGPTGMGRLYKALAIVPYIEEAPVRRPVGFGGGVVG